MLRRACFAARRAGGSGIMPCGLQLADGFEERERNVQACAVWEGRHRQIDHRVQPGGCPGRARPARDAGGLRPQVGLVRPAPRRRGRAHGARPHAPGRHAHAGGSGARGRRRRALRGGRRPDTRRGMCGPGHHRGVRPAQAAQGLRGVPARLRAVRRAGRRGVRRLRDAPARRVLRRGHGGDERRDDVALRGGQHHARPGGLPEARVCALCGPHRQHAQRGGRGRQDRALLRGGGRLRARAHPSLACSGPSRGAAALRGGRVPRV